MKGSAVLLFLFPPVYSWNILHFVTHKNAKCIICTYGSLKFDHRAQMNPPGLVGRCVGTNLGTGTFGRTVRKKAKLQCYCFAFWRTCLEMAALRSSYSLVSFARAFDNFFVRREQHSSCLALRSILCQI